MSYPYPTPPTSVTDSRLHWLDQALEGEPPEVKARVLNILLRYQIDPENEFFVIFVALGQLMSLTEDAPQAWQGLFKSFAGELELWSQNFLKTIHEINHQARTVEQLTVTLNNSNALFRDLLTILLQLSDTYKRSQQDMSSLPGRFDNLNSSLTSRMTEIERSTTALNAKLTSWYESNQQNSSLSWSVSLALVLGVVLGLGSGLLLWRVSNTMTPAVPTSQLPAPQTLTEPG